MSPASLFRANWRSLAGEGFAQGQGEAVLRCTFKVVSTLRENHAEPPAETVAEPPRTAATRLR
jgi:hypothetical protein